MSILLCTWIPFSSRRRRELTFFFFFFPGLNFPRSLFIFFFLGRKMCVCVWCMSQSKDEKLRAQVFFCYHFFFRVCISFHLLLPDFISIEKKKHSWNSGTGIISRELNRSVLDYILFFLYILFLPSFFLNVDRLRYVCVLCIHLLHVIYLFEFQSNRVNLMRPL